MSTKRVRKESKFIKYMRLPSKLLARARDFYVHSLTACAGQLPYGNATVGCPTPHLASFTRSFSSNSSRGTSRDDDLRELIRIASTRSLTEKFEAELLRSKTSSPLSGVGLAGVPRSCSVAICRIDEDKPCDFGGDHVGGRPEAYPRSRSYAASRSRMV